MYTFTQLYARTPVMITGPREHGPGMTQAHATGPRAYAPTTCLQYQCTRTVTSAEHHEMQGRRRPNHSQTYEVAIQTPTSFHQPSAFACSCAEIRSAQARPRSRPRARTTQAQTCNPFQCVGMLVRRASACLTPHSCACLTCETRRSRITVGCATGRSEVPVALQLGRNARL